MLKTNNWMLNIEEGWVIEESTFQKQTPGLNFKAFSERYYIFLAKRSNTKSITSVKSRKLFLGWKPIYIAYRVYR
jgi:hypothetical protein